MKSLLRGAIMAWAITATAFADDSLFEKFDPANITTTDAQATANDAVLRVVTGHAEPWPGVRLAAPAGHWDLSSHTEVAADVKNIGTNPVTVFCRVDNPGADGTKHCVTGSISLQPGQAGTFTVPLKRESGGTLDGKLFGMRGYPVAPGESGDIDPKNITQLLFFVDHPAADHKFEITQITATGSYTPPTASVTDAAPFFPFIDTFGQYNHKNWPGKTQSLADLAAKREQEAADLAAHPGPDDWDQYGGAATGPQLKATGFFRTKKIGGKWWLVDPAGHRFFSHGIDCVRMLDATPIEERSTWFADFPGDQPEFKEFFSEAYCLMGHYAGRTVKCFSFSGANLRRKYGVDWKTVYPELVQRRLRSWGLNTIGNWSDAATCRLRRAPYTDTIGSHNVRQIEGSEGYWGKFPDVFDPGFAASLRRDMDGKKSGSAGDPWCLGYFSDNEMSWGDDTSLAVATLKSPADQAAKKVFLADLQAKYGDIARLNSVWGTAHKSWDDLLQSREAPDKHKAEADLAAFYTRIAEQYFRTVRDTIKAVAPAQLYLGCRFADSNDRAALAAAKFCDVVSFNLYRRSVADFRFPGGADAPVLIGEFHLGALDRGLFHPGLVPVADQAARAQAYFNYVNGALHHPQIVGTHWFQYQDEPTTGRSYDGENYQIGFVDVADTPYAETIAASRRIGASLYR
jgi:hypothetical protein